VDVFWGRDVWAVAIVVNYYNLVWPSEA